MIYLDNAGTTKMFENLLEEYKKYACNLFYNASAGYNVALENSKALDEARKTVLSKLGLKTGVVLFTGGATESNNLALQGSKRNGKWEYVFSAGEHPSVYNTALHLQEEGFVVHFVPLQKNGEIDYTILSQLINSKTRLISIIHVNNETGAINDIDKIAEIKRQFAPNALLHVDGVQAFCKIPMPKAIKDVDLYTISAHKFHGPKGVGALYIKNIDALKNIVYGGGQEFGKRSGTENLPAIMAMKMAIENIDENENFKHVSCLKERFLSVFKDQSGVSFIDTASPYIISMNFAGVNGETLMRSLEGEGVIISTGSACSSKHAGNRILQQMGFSKDFVKSSVRISFNAYQTESEVETAAKIILQKYKEIWERVK